MWMSTRRLQRLGASRLQAQGGVGIERSDCHPGDGQRRSQTRGRTFPNHCRFSQHRAEVQQPSPGVPLCHRVGVRRHKRPLCRDGDLDSTSRSTTPFHPERVAPRPKRRTRRSEALTRATRRIGEQDATTAQPYPIDVVGPAGGRGRTRLVAARSTLSYRPALWSMMRDQEALVRRGCRHRDRASALRSCDVTRGV